MFTCVNVALKCKLPDGRDRGNHPLSWQSKKSIAVPDEPRKEIPWENQSIYYNKMALHPVWSHTLMARARCEGLLAFSHNHPPQRIKTGHIVGIMKTRMPEYHLRLGLSIYYYSEATLKWRAFPLFVKSPSFCWECAFCDIDVVSF